MPWETLFLRSVCDNNTAAILMFDFILLRCYTICNDTVMWGYTMKKLLALGIVGTLLSLIGDILLGWMVYPQMANHYTAMLAGCAELSYARMGLSALFGGIGIPMQYYGFKAVAHIIRKDTSDIRRLRLSKAVRIAALSIASLGGSVHILCIVGMLSLRIEADCGFTFSDTASFIECIPASSAQIAVWAILPVTAVMMTPYLIGAAAMFIAVVRGYTPFPKWMCVFNPIIIKIALNAAAALIPQTAFSNALGMSNMAFGGLLPFAAFLIYLSIDRETNTK